MNKYVCGSRIRLIKDGINALKSTYKKQGKKYVDNSDNLVGEIYIKFKLGPDVVPKDNTQYSEARMLSKGYWNSFINCIRTGEIYKLYKINGEIPDSFGKEMLKRYGF
jgi:hypothetical protein